MNNIESLKSKLNVEIDSNILNEVLMHRSYLNENKNDEIVASNIMRCFIGKSILNLIIKLYYISETTYTLSEITNKVNLKIIVEDFYKTYNLGKYIYLGKSEQNNDVLYTDHVYMLIYEIYNKNGLNNIYYFLKDLIVRNKSIDYKTLLQEYTQKFNVRPLYTVIESIEGTNKNNYKVRVSALGKSYTASSSSKKVAEKLAAEKFVKENNIKIDDSKKNKKLELLRKGYNWNVTEDRKNQIVLGLKTFNFSQQGIKLPVYIWDASFTHKSINSPNKDNNTIFISLGAEIINVYTRIYLSYHKDRYTSNTKLFNQDASMILKESNLETAIINKYGKDWLKSLELCPNIENEKLAVETYKSLLGGILYYNFYKNKKQIPQELDVFYKQNIKFLELDDSDIDRNDYNNWLIDLEQQLGIPIYKLDEKSYGKDHNKIYYSKLIMNLESYQLNNLEVDSEETSKSKLNNELSKKMYFKLRKLCNLDCDLNIHNSDTYNIFIRDIINYILKKNAFFNTKLGLLGKLNTPNSIIKNLYNRRMYREVKNFIDTEMIDNELFKESIDLESEIAFLFEKNKHIDNYSETKYVERNILLEKNIKFTNQVKINKNLYYKIRSNDLVVLLEVVEFNHNNKCQYCNGNLEIKHEAVLLKCNNNAYPVISEVSYCPICNVYGFNSSQADDIISENFTYKIYEGNAAYYSSCIVKFCDIDIYLHNKIKQKTYIKKPVTPSELEHQLAILKDIGQRGEEIIYNYEKNLLIKIGRNDLASKVEWIAKQDCTAGYDILSYDINGNKKYIEVKSSTGSSDKFYLSKNEIEVARKYGENYFIYKVNNIKRIPYINKIRNPLQCIDEGMIQLEATQFLANLI